MQEKRIFFLTILFCSLKRVSEGVLSTMYGRYAQGRESAREGGGNEGAREWVLSTMYGRYAQGRRERGREGWGFIDHIWSIRSREEGTREGGREGEGNEGKPQKKKKKRTKRKIKKLFSSLSPTHYYSILRYTTYTTLVPQTRSS